MVERRGAMSENGRASAADEPHLLVRADDGTAYAIPRSIVEAHRLSGEQWAALQERAQADGLEVAGYQFIGTFPTGTPGPPVRQYDPANPVAGGWDGVGLRYIPPQMNLFSGTATVHKRTSWP